jgi:Holliday junction resolvase RusA-like endonuclease
VRIIAYGTPAPQGSKKVLGRTKTGKTILGEASDNTTPWRADVMTAARAVLEELGWPTPYDKPILARMVFSFARPRAHYRTGKNSHILRDDAPNRPVAKNLGDLCKLARAVEDALTAAGVWVDDSLVVDYLRLAKVYCNEDPEALDRPGCVIILGQLVELVQVGGTPPMEGSRHAGLRSVNTLPRAA